MYNYSSLNLVKYHIVSSLFFVKINVELKKARADLDTMKKQAESTSTEYDRLAEEHQKLQVSFKYSSAQCLPHPSMIHS